MFSDLIRFESETGWMMNVEIELELMVLGVFERRLTFRCYNPWQNLDTLSKHNTL
jgi:hypothetical protein